MTMPPTDQLRGVLSPEPDKLTPPTDQRRILGHGCVNPDHLHHMRNDMGCWWVPIFEDIPQIPAKWPPPGNPRRYMEEVSRAD